MLSYKVICHRTASVHAFSHSYMLWFVCMGVHKYLIYSRQITMGCHYLMLFTIELFVITVISCLFMAMINNSILTSATRSASCDRGAPNPQGWSSGERNRNNEEVVQVFTRKYYHIMVFRHINYHINAFTRKYYHIKVIGITGCHYLMLFTSELFVITVTSCLWQW